MMQMQAFDDGAHRTWGQLWRGLARCRAEQAHPTFTQGLAALGMDGARVPELHAINARLAALTGWQGVPVAGLEDGLSFFELLSQRRFPVGNFIRAADDLSYTPAPDVFHDMYGHLPFLADPAYADFHQRFGQAAMAAIDVVPDALRQFERLFWFGVEFCLIETAQGRRIFGGGILSSSAESDYCLSSQPDVFDFDIDVIRHQTYRIDQIQPRLFVVASPEQLFGCLEPFVAGLARPPRRLH